MLPYLDEFRSTQPRSSRLPFMDEFRAGQPQKNGLPFMDEFRAASGMVTPQDDFSQTAEARRRREAGVPPGQGLEALPADSTGAGLKGAGAALVNTIPVVGRANRRFNPSPVDLQAGGGFMQGAAQLASNLPRSLGEIFGGAVAGAMAGGPAGIPIGAAGAAASGQADDLAYEEMLKRLRGQAPEESGYGTDLARGTGMAESSPDDTTLRRTLRALSVPLAGAGAGAGAVLARAAGPLANIGFDVADAALETGVNLGGQGMAPGDPGWARQIGMSAGLGGLVSGLGQRNTGRRPGSPLPEPEVLSAPDLPVVSRFTPGGRAIQGRPLPVPEEFTMNVPLPETERLGPAVLPKPNFPRPSRVPVASREVPVGELQKALALTEELQAAAVAPKPNFSRPKRIEATKREDTVNAEAIRSDSGQIGTEDVIQASARGGGEDLQRNAEAGRSAAVGQAPGQEVAAKQPWEMTREEFERDAQRRDESYNAEQNRLWPKDKYDQTGLLRKGTMYSKKAVSLLKMEYGLSKAEAGRRLNDARERLATRKSMQVSVQPKTGLGLGASGATTIETYLFNTDDVHSIGRMYLVERAVKDNKPVPRAVLEEFAGEPWADAALAKMKGGEANEAQGQGQGLLSQAPEVRPQEPPAAVVDKPQARSIVGYIRGKERNSVGDWNDFERPVYEIRGPYKSPGTSFGDWTVTLTVPGWRQGEFREGEEYFFTKKKAQARIDEIRNAKPPATPAPTLKQKKAARQAAAPEPPPVIKGQGDMLAGEPPEITAAKKRLSAKAKGQQLQAGPFDPQSAADAVKVTRYHAGRLAQRVGQMGQTDSIVGRTAEKANRIVQLLGRNEQALRANETGRKHLSELTGMFTRKNMLAGGWMALAERAEDGQSFASRRWMGKKWMPIYEKNGVAGISAQAAKDLSPADAERVKAFTAVFNTIDNEIGDLAIQDGVMLRDSKKGGRRVPFKKITNHVQHSFTKTVSDAMDRGRGDPVYNAIMDHAKQSLDLTPGDIESMVRRQFSAKEYGPLENVRVARFPYELTTRNGKKFKVLESNPSALLNDAIENASGRLAFIEYVNTLSESKTGQKDAVKLGEKIATELYESGTRGEGGNMARAFRDVWKQVNSAEPDTLDWHMEALRGAENIARVAQLSLSSITQLSGMSPAATMSGPIKATAGLVKAMTAAASDRLGLKTKSKAEMDVLRSTGAWMRDTLGHTATTEDLTEFADKYIGRPTLKATQFERTNRIINMASAHAGVTDFADAIAALRDPKGGAVRRLFGMDEKSLRGHLQQTWNWTDAEIDRMVKNGVDYKDFVTVAKKAENNPAMRKAMIDIARAAQGATAKANVFRETPLTRPGIVTGRGARLAFAYMSYLRAKGNILSDTMRSASSGNLKPLVTLLGADALGGAAVTKLKDLVFDREHDEDTPWYVTLLDWWSEAATLGVLGGMAEDAYWAVKTGGDRAPISLAQYDWIANAVLGAPYQAAKKFEKTGNFSDAALEYYRRVGKKTPLVRAIDTRLEGPIWDARPENKPVKLGRPRHLPMP